MLLVGLAFTKSEIEFEEKTQRTSKAIIKTK